jgi:hypothetical protein
MIWVAKPYKIDSREHKMNTVTKSILGQVPTEAVATAPATSTSTKTLATLMLAAGVAALVVLADQLIDSWAESHVVAAWLALWAVAAVAIGVLRGATRVLAQNLMGGLDALSAHVARRRADERLWAMAQTDSRLMQDLQLAMDRSEDKNAPVTDLTTYMTRRASRIVHHRLHCI